MVRLTEKVLAAAIVGIEKQVAEGVLSRERADALVEAGRMCVTTEGAYPRTRALSSGASMTVSARSVGRESAELRIA